MIDPEFLVERKIYKSQIMKWKVGFILLIVVGFGLFFGHDLEKRSSFHQDYIGTVLFEDLIYEDYKRDENLTKIVEDSNVKALIVNINSPGGTAVGSEKIYYILRKIAEKKPVVVVMGSVAASGGYMISLAGDHIIAHNTTTTGSIGVIMMSTEVTELAEKLGIKFENFKSGELKASPNAIEKTTTAVREAIMETVDDNYKFFVELVAERRKLDLNRVKQISDGRIYTGRQAVELKLVDAVGTFDDAIKWLQDNKAISNKLKIKEISLKPESSITDLLMQDFGTKISNILQNKLQGFKSIRAIF
jgi:protease-4